MTISAERKLFQAGHLAKGTVYALLGILSFTLIFGASQSFTGKKEALSLISEQPFGQALLIILAIGLISYAFWRWMSAYDNFQEEDGKKDGVGKPIAWIFSGLAYIALAVYAIQMVWGGSQNSGQGGGAKEDLAATVMQMQGGQIAIIILGVIFVGVAGYQFYKGWKEKYAENVDLSSANSKEKDLYHTLGKIGHFARAVVFGIIAYFLILAGMQANPDKVKGTGEAIQYLQENQYGLWLVGLMGVGLIAYGAFMFVKSQYGKA